MTPFGWVYVILTIIASLIQITLIGKPRKALTSRDVISNLIGAGLGLGGLYIWGLR